MADLTRFPGVQEQPCDSAQSWVPFEGRRQQPAGMKRVVRVALRWRRKAGTS